MSDERVAVKRSNSYGRVNTAIRIGLAACILVVCAASATVARFESGNSLYKSYLSYKKVNAGTGTPADYENTNYFLGYVWPLQTLLAISANTEAVLAAT